MRTDEVNIPDGGRFDFSGHDALAGAENIDAVGMAAFTPEKVPTGALAKYYITNARYIYECIGASCNDFVTAFVVPHRPATSKTTFGGVSTMNGEVSIVELNNVENDAVKVRLRIFEVDGTQAGATIVKVPAKATRHIIVNRVGESGFLSSEMVGSAEVTAVDGTISAATLFYKLLDPNQPARMIEKVKGLQ